MNLTLATLSIVALAIIAGLWAWTRRIRKAGEDSVRADVAADTIEAMQRQAEAQANAPQGKGAIVDRLMEKGL